jgi:simple sugar transport system substrate-binding protein
MRILSSRDWAVSLTLVALSIVAAACTGGEGGAGSTGTVLPEESTTTSMPLTSESRLRLALVAHVDEPDFSGFWMVVSLGALETAEANDVDLEIVGDADPDVQARIVDTLIAGDVDGLIVSLAAPETLKPALDRAAAAGIPVVTINSGIEHYRETSALTHVGQDEFTAGRAVGERLTAMGLEGDALCVVQESNNAGLEARCDGVEAAYRGGAVVRARESVDMMSQADTVALVSGRLESGGIAAVVTLDLFTGWAAADAVIAARADAVVTTFDTWPEAFDRIRNGEIAFTIDQQPYLQGSIPVQLLVDYLRNGSTPDSAQPVETGPFVIDATNIDEVAQETKEIDERIGVRFFS